MKAAFHRDYGSPDVLSIVEVEAPRPGPGELRIAVEATAVTRTDCHMLRAQPFLMRFVTGFTRPRQPIPGTAFAGRVEARGEGVTRFEVGDRVFGFDDRGVGSFAPFMVYPADQRIARMPANASAAEAAAIIEGAHYAINFVNKVRIREGQRALVNGATGANGAVAVQLLRNRGVEVVAVCRGQHAELVTRLGASRVIDYEVEDFTRTQERFDFVFDTVGKSSFGKCRHLLEARGVYISSELGWMAQNLFYALLTPLLRGRLVRFPAPLDTPASLRLVTESMEKGELEAVIDRSVPLEEVADAFRYVETGQKVGSVVLVPS